MEQDTLRKLELLNQLSLNEVQKANLLAFFADREKELDVLNAMNTDDVERMVHVMPIMTVVREDIASQPFSRDELQKGAPDTNQGYWCVPRVVE
ncbi:MAG: Asp-tRNA(Asn)/Glu-tRNA(Gln) amidotransferase subunit GatC [Oscillospiraceae bacterium]|nr:Asp-tRNA(Asn)/Glu-tRNA(Gln) amidotransferase subunit GatC [Oscillospiraceae bacterium]